MVDSIGLISSRVELPSQREERFRVVHEEGDVKYGGRVRNLVLLEVVIETSPRSSGGMESSYNVNMST